MIGQLWSRDHNTILLLVNISRYKQATVGRCNVEKPSFYQLTEKAKWNAWNDLGDKSREGLYVNVILKSFLYQMHLKSRNEADLRIDIEGYCFRTDAQLEYIQRLTELEPDFSQTEVGGAQNATQIFMFLKNILNENIVRLPSPVTGAG